MEREKSVAGECRIYFIREDFHRVFNHCPRSLFIYSESKISRKMGEKDNKAQTRLPGEREKFSTEIKNI
jgi:hypothetical protein